jgi:hypothetical protein
METIRLPRGMNWRASCSGRTRSWPNSWSSTCAYNRSWTNSGTEKRIRRKRPKHLYNAHARAKNVSLYTTNSHGQLPFQAEPVHGDLRLGETLE